MMASLAHMEPRRHTLASDLSGEMDAVKYQLDQYKTTNKQLSVLLVHRNKEIEVLLQEMHLKSALRADSTQGSPLIPAVWGKSAIKAVQMFELDDDDVARQSARGQVAPELLASKRKGDVNSRSLHPHKTAVTGVQTYPHDESLKSADDMCLSVTSGEIFAAAPFPGCALSTAVTGSEKAAEPSHVHGMAMDDFSGVQFREAFWALPEWKFSTDPSAPTQTAALAYHNMIPWPESVRELDAANFDASTQPAQRMGDSRDHMDERPAKSHSLAGQVDVANSQVKALQDLILSLQVQLERAHHKHSALCEQLSHTSACLQHLQHAQQAWELERALQAAEMDAGTSRSAAMPDSTAAQLQVTEAALHQALLHEGQLMADLISLEPAAPVSEIESDASWLSDTAGEGRTPQVMQCAANASLAAEHGGSAMAERLEGVTVSAVGDSQVAAKTQQLRHAHSVIAELSSRLAELECCNALLQDQLAISATDLIKSGPQDRWLPDSFPWSARASEEIENNKSQSSASTKALINSRQDAESDAQVDDLVESSLALTAGQLNLLGSTESADDVATSIDAADHTSADNQGSMPLATRLTDGGPVQISRPEASRDDGGEGRLGDPPEGEGQSTVTWLHSSAAPQSGYQGPFTASKKHRSPAAPAAPGQQASAWRNAMPDVTHTLTTQAGDGAKHMSFSRLSAAEEQNARLAATHAELERCLLHAQNQLRDFAGAASAQLPAPAIVNFHAAREALTQAMAEVQTSGRHNAEDVRPCRDSPGPARVSTSSQGDHGHATVFQAPYGPADVESELVATRARLVHTAEQLAESERCRDNLQQQLLDVGEARLDAHTYKLQDSTTLRPEAADSAARLERLAQQLAESERCRDSLQHQLLDLGEARFTAGSVRDEPARQPASQHTPHEDLEEGKALSCSGGSPAGKDAALVWLRRCSACGESQSAAERAPGSTLETATSEVAALRVAMTQSEAIFLDLEAQLRAAFEREAASQHRIAALEQELKQAGMHPTPASVMQPATAQDAMSALVPFVQHQGSAIDISMMPSQSEEARAIVVCGSGNIQEAAQRNMPAEHSSQQAQLLTAHLRAALQQLSDAEAVIERLHDQLFDQHALITELKSALSASGQSFLISDARAGLGAAIITRAGPSGKALQLAYPVSTSLQKMAILEETPSYNASQLGTAEDMQLVGDVSKAPQVVYSIAASGASVSDLQTSAKPAMPGFAHMSQLAVICALIAGQTESPEELCSMVMHEEIIPPSYSQEAHRRNAPARLDTTPDRKEEITHKHMGSADSASQLIRENPLFLQESAHSSDEESQGSEGEDEAHHRTVRGREAREIVHRLKNSYLHRSMSAPDAALSPGMSGGAGVGRRAAAGRAAGRRRSSRQALQGARPWSLPSLKRALAEQRRGSAAPSSGSFGVRSSSCGSMPMGGEEDEDIEILDTIYANWGDIDQAPDAGERDASKELTASLAERCDHLEKALHKATCQLAESRAAEARLQSRNSILSAENCALTARLTELKQEHQRHRPAQREQAAYKPASRATAAPPPAASPSGAGALLGPLSTKSSHRALPTGTDAGGGGQPCSRYAWELQDLHLRMAAAIAQIRELEADKAKVARQLVSACAAAEDIPWPASYTEQGAGRAGWNAAACHARPPMEGSEPLPSCRRD